MSMNHSLRLFCVLVTHIVVMLALELHADEIALKASLKEGENILHQGGTLTITATGEAAKQVLAETGSGVGRRKLSLYLNGIEIPGADALASLRQDHNTLNLMAGLTAAKERVKVAQADAAEANDTKAPANLKATAASKQQEVTTALRNLDVAQKAFEKGAKIVFSLVVDRDSESDASRRAWDALLRQHRHSPFEVSLALGIGSAVPLLVDGPEGVKGVKFETSAHPGWGVGVCVTFLVGWVVFLICKPHLLRSEGNPDYAFSLSRTQMAFWGIIVISSFVGVMVALGRLEHIPAQTLVLMGISVTTGLTASLMDDGKPPTWKAAAERGRFKGFFDDLCIGDNGASFHRVQLMLWTVVLGGFFLWSVSQIISMPEFSPMLLVLMGITNGTYLGFTPQEKPAANKPATDKPEK